MVGDSNIEIGARSDGFNIPGEWQVDWPSQVHQTHTPNTLLNITCTFYIEKLPNSRNERINYPETLSHVLDINGRAPSLQMCQSTENSEVCTACSIFGFPKYISYKAKTGITYLVMLI